MTQSKLESAIEQVLNVASGFILSLLLWVYVISPVYGIQVSMIENLEITIAFTLISLVRGYVWRRLFNGRIIHKLVAFLKC